MKLFFLNAWCGEVKSQLENFIKEQSLTTDVFCFQEATDEKNNWLFKDFLTQYNLVTDCKVMTDESEFFQATYINKTSKIITTKTLLQDDHDIGLCIYTQIQNQNKILNICNVHGVAYPGNKLDNSSRLKQSQIIIDFLKKISGPKIIGGDFNLEFDTQSVKMFEDNGYRNLIKDYKITTTRNNLSWEKYPNNKQYFADFTFISPDIKVLNFSVPNLEISDHLPMILEI